MIASGATPARRHPGRPAARPPAAAPAAAGRRRSTSASDCRRGPTANRPGTGSAKTAPPGWQHQRGRSPAQRRGQRHPRRGGAAAASSLDHQRPAGGPAVDLGPVHRLGGRRRAPRSGRPWWPGPGTRAAIRPAARASANTSARSSRSSWCCQACLPAVPPPQRVRLAVGPALRSCVRWKRVITGSSPAGRRSTTATWARRPGEATVSRTFTACPSFTAVESGPGVGVQVAPGGWPARASSALGGRAARSTCSRAP